MAGELINLYAERQVRTGHAFIQDGELQMTFDAAFPQIRKEIESGTTWEDRIANAVYLLRASRNQVAHSIDDSMVLFKDPMAATFTVDVLLSLCRVEGWTN